MITQDPRNMTWDYWCSLTAELFAPNQLGTATEQQWREWADSVSGIGYFSNSGVADSRGFATWQDWAQHLTNTMSISS